MVLSRLVGICGWLSFAPLLRADQVCEKFLVSYLTGCANVAYTASAVAIVLVKADNIGSLPQGKGQVKGIVIGSPGD